MLPLGVVQLAFDPLLRLDGLEIRWQTIALAGALMVAIAVAALITSRTAAYDSEGARVPRLRLDELGYVVLAIVPGAVLGGRLVHGLVFWEFYAQDPMRLLDPAAGSLSLLGAVLGGSLTGAYVASLLGGSVARWGEVATVPMLLALGLGKLTQLLGGAGQGAPFDGPWAIAFVGPGPWQSLHPAVPAHPAQVYEGAWLLLGALLIGVLFLARAFALGRLFLLALSWFLLGRLLVGYTWRDDPVLGQLNGEQVGALLVLGVLAVFAVLRRPVTPTEDSAFNSP
jgi:phosphatidylglycerol---prolipoprotein diacylglyceryl transferase